jgi:hypothetical protein
MTSAKWHTVRLSLEGCPICEDLPWLQPRIADARRCARNLYRAASHATDCAALQNLDQEWKQTSAAHKLVCYAVNAHLANRHSQTCGVRWTA